jgi:hypothetical protein
VGGAGLAEDLQMAENLGLRAEREDSQVADAQLCAYCRGFWVTWVPLSTQGWTHRGQLGVWGAGAAGRKAGTLGSPPVVGSGAGVTWGFSSILEKALWRPMVSSSG